MALRIIQIFAETKLKNTLESVINTLGVHDWWKSNEDEERISYAMVASLENTQNILDILQSTFGYNKNTRILVLPLEATLPQPFEIEKELQKQYRFIEKTSGGISREELYDHVVDGAKLNINYMLLVFLSTIVAVIGLLENNIAVLIGAMVIAPLLGPNLAMSLATSLGDRELMIKAAVTNFTGLFICLLFSYLIGSIWPYEFNSAQLLAQTGVGIDGIIIALTAGAAAVLSLTSGKPNLLIGMMAAVALLTPTTMIGITLGAKEYYHTIGAFLLLSVNLVCVNLAANLVFLFRGVRPSRWYEKQKAKTAHIWYIIFWSITLIVLVIVVYFRNGFIFIS